MKTLFKRLICICIAVMLCVSSLHMIVSFAADEPQLSSKCESIIELDGMDTNFGEDTTTLRTNTRIKYSSNRDLSEMDAIELSVYVENYIAIRNALGKDQKIRLSFSSSSIKENLATSSAHAVISDQITEHGWNTVSLKKSDFVGTIDWKKIRYIYLSFADESLDLAENIRNKPIKFKNVCDVVVIPEMTDGDVKIFEDSVINSLGDSEESMLSGVAERFSASFDAVDISEADVIKFDVFMTDKTAFDTLNGTNPLQFGLLSDNGKLFIDSVTDFISRPEKGWYTAQFSVNSFYSDGEFDLENVNGIEAFFTYTADAKLGNVYDQKLGIANVRGIILAAKEGTETFGVVVDDHTDMGKVVNVIAKTFDGTAFYNNRNYKALSGADYIEFDYYVDNCEAFKEALKFDKENNPIDATLNFVLKQGTNTLTFKGLENQILANGWNHVIFDIDEGVNNGFDLSASYDQIGFEYDDVDGTLNNACCGSLVALQNYVTTKGLPEGEVKFDKVSDIADGKETDLGDTFADSTISEKFDAVDITGAAFVEFDVYVQNFTAFNSILAGTDVTDIKLRLASGTEIDEDSIIASILGQITKNGWNRVTTAYSKFAAENGTFDITGVKSWSLVYGGDDTVNTGALKGLKIAVKDIAASNVKDPEIPDNFRTIINEEGKEGIYGAKYNYLIDDSMVNLGTPVDATTGGQLEFDFYVEDYVAFKEMIEEADKPLYFALGTLEDKYKRRAIYKFTDQVTGEGWNHIVLKRLGYETGIGDDAPQFEHVYRTFLTFWDESDANPAAGQPFKYKNVCITPAEYEDVPEPAAHDFVITDDIKTTTWGNQCVWIHDRMFKMFDEPVSISGYDKIEFDIYIENYENYQKMIEVASSPLYFLLNTDTTTIYNRRALYVIEDKITHQGWNHVVIKAKEQTSGGGDAPMNFSTVAGARLTFWTAAEANPCKDDIVRISNVVGSYAAHTKNPALPDNVLAQLGNEADGTHQAGNTVGDYFHYTQDRIYQQRLTPVDFSLAPVVEFDIYIDDYEMFLAAENDPADGRNSKLSFVISSTPVSLWDQYGNQSRMYYNGRVGLAQYITHEGWNHVKVGQADFKTINHGINWSAVTGFYVYYDGSSNFYPYKNANKNLYVKVANVVNTGVVANIPADPDKPSKPDKDAVYISTADGTADENGSWNSTIGDVQTKYKTEGTGAMMQGNDYTSEIDSAVMYYLFDDTADMSDMKTLKFDFFIDLPQYLNKPTNKVEVLVGNSRFARDDYYYWNMELDMKQGWNEVSFDLKDAKKMGDPDLTEAKVIMLRFTELDLDPNEFEEIVYGLDNLRYISSTGNTTLRVEGWDEGLEPDEPEDPSDNNQETPNEPDAENPDEQVEEQHEEVPQEQPQAQPGEQTQTTPNKAPQNIVVGDPKVETQEVVDTVVVESDPVENVQVVETTVNKTGKTKINRIVQKYKVTDYLVVAIVLGIEAVVLAAGVVIFMLIYRRKLRK